MTVADYALAALCVVGCLVWGGISLLVATIDSFMPAPSDETAKIGKAGCASFLSAVAAAAWFTGVLWTGDWGWLS